MASFVIYQNEETASLIFQTIFDKKAIIFFVEIVSYLNAKTEGNYLVYQRCWSKKKKLNIKTIEKVQRYLKGFKDSLIQFHSNLCGGMFQEIQLSPIGFLFFFWLDGHFLIFFD